MEVTFSKVKQMINNKAKSSQDLENFLLNHISSSNFQLIKSQEIETLFLIISFLLKKFETEIKNFEQNKRLSKRIEFTKTTIDIFNHALSEKIKKHG